MKMNPYEKEHLKRLRRYLPECTVLLKSSGSFPLDGPCKIAAYGSGVRHTIKGGTGSGDVNSRFTINVEEGLSHAGFTVTTGLWLDAYDQVLAEAHKAFIEDIKARAKAQHMPATLFGMGAVMPEPEYEIALTAEGDAAIYVLSRICGEGNDRNAVKGDLLLTDTEVRDILALNEKFDKFMLVLNTGGPVDLTPVKDVDNILYLSQLGVDTGFVLAKLLLGDYYPSGKLTTTWDAWENYPSVGDFGDINETHYKEGIYVGYRYFDSIGHRAAYPFGFGLSYTTFAFEGTAVSFEGENVSVKACITNTGSRPGREVEEVYISLPQGKLDQPYQTLAAFAKTDELAPGQTGEVTACFAMSDIASYDTEASAWVLPAGDYIVRVGASSVDTAVAAVIRLTEEICVRKVRAAGGDCGFTDWKPVVAPGSAAPENAPVYLFDASLIKCEEVVYDKEEEIDPFIASIADEEAATLCVGGFDPKGGALSVIGNASMSVAGAAGETSAILEDNGVPTLVMADGPAGLRLNKEYTVDADGIHPIGSSFPAGMTDFLPPIANFFLENVMTRKPRKGETVYTQYATAIPIGTALAQSWNPETARVCGDIVGAEMERFGVHLWLAPALNIHRSVLCGRNFEYFSEDPLISGLFAAAITDGVQAHAGRGTTIKHYCANNQETNRMGDNSRVSERALREIYLKGFEICVRRSQPHALMTSYNLLNGVHTSERRDLTTDILRAEFGYEGIVMTDWVITAMMDKKSIHPAAHASATVAAGGDLFMPGTKNDVKDIMKALEEGTLDIKAVHASATRVVKMVELLRGV